jgi:serine/threonine-protein kinase RIO1
MADESLEIRVAVVERDIDNISSFFDRLDTAMEKLTDVSVSVKELLAVHELKLTQASEADQDLYKLYESIKNDIVELQSKQTIHQWFFTGTAAFICFILYKLKIIPYMSPLL